MNNFPSLHNQNITIPLFSTNQTFSSNQMPEIDKRPDFYFDFSPRALQVFFENFLSSTSSSEDVYSSNSGRDSLAGAVLSIESSSGKDCSITEPLLNSTSSSTNNSAISFTPSPFSISTLPTFAENEINTSTELAVYRAPRRNRQRRNSSRNEDEEEYRPHQLSISDTPLRRTTRSEAQNAVARINNIYAVSMEDNTDEEEYIDEPVVNLNDISSASDEEPSVLFSFADFKTKKSFGVFNRIRKRLGRIGRASIPCTICFKEKAENPVKSICCTQPIGCKTCIKRWYYTTNISHLNSSSPLSHGQNHMNHKSCPFCREEWPNGMRVVNC